jgi:hypothetical protein
VLPPVQAVLQDPQWLLSVLRLTQAPLQFVWPAPHVTTHCPPEHAVPWGQTWPQAPQLLLSLPSFTQLPAQSV